MSKPYDASTKYLLEAHPADWLTMCPRSPGGRVEVIDTDLATVSALADKVLYIHGNPGWILHVELQASWDESLLRRIHCYNALLEHRHSCLVHSLLLLLRREANSPALTGHYQLSFPGEAPYRTFTYQVVRLWEQPLPSFLEAGLGVLPLAPLTDEASTKLPDVIHRMDERLQQEASPEEAGNLWTVTDVLLGLRYARNMIDPLMQ
jgi:hypothetical protein